MLQLFSLSSNKRKAYNHEVKWSISTIQMIKWQGIIENLANKENSSQITKIPKNSSLPSKLIN